MHAQGTKMPFLQNHTNKKDVCQVDQNSFPMEGGELETNANKMEK